MIALPALLMDIKLFDCCAESGTGHETGGWRQNARQRTAVGWSINCTFPCVGSPPVKKFHPEKNVFPDYVTTLYWDGRKQSSTIFFSVLAGKLK
jgi:hypothetical protein